jgi:hypothetical protein
LPVWNHAGCGGPRGDGGGGREPRPAGEAGRGLHPSTFSEANTTFRTDQLAAASPQQHHAPWMPGAQDLSGFCGGGGIPDLVRLRLGHGKGLALSTAQALEPDLSRAVLLCTDPDDLGKATASNRTGHHLASHVRGEWVRGLERRRRPNDVALPVVGLAAALRPARPGPGGARPEHRANRRKRPLALAFRPDLHLILIDKAGALAAPRRVIVPVVAATLARPLGRPGARRARAQSRACGLFTCPVGS